MNFWLVRADAPSVTVDSKVGMIIRSRTAPRLKVGDQIVLANNGKFTKHGIVQKVDSSDGRTSALQPFSYGGRIKLAVEKWESIADSKIADLRFSLTFIKDVNRPERHLRRNYRSVKASDFRTIVHGEVFLARTAYFELLTSLPGDTRLKFEILQMRTHRTNDPFLNRLEALETFIEQRVLSVGRLLVNLMEKINILQVESEDGQPMKHYFSSASIQKNTAATPRRSRQIPGSDDDIAAQLALFQPLLKQVQSNHSVSTFQEIIKETKVALADAQQQTIDTRIQRAFLEAK